MSTVAGGGLRDPATCVIRQVGDMVIGSGDVAYPAVGVVIREGRDQAGGIGDRRKIAGSVVGIGRDIRYVGARTVYRQHLAETVVRIGPGARRAGQRGGK